MEVIKEAVRGIRTVRTSMNVPPSKKAKVYVVSENEKLLEIFEENSIAIAADDVAHESRSFRTDAPEDEKDPMMALAKQFANIDYDVLLYDQASSKNRRGEFVADMVKESGAQVCSAGQIDARVLTQPEELALVKSLAQYPEELHLAARDYDPSRINRYLTALAGDFHRFYNACRLKGEEEAVLSARLKLADTVRSVLANGLNLLGVIAPVKM